VITEATLKLVPKPPAVATAFAIFREHHAAGAAVTAILRSGFRPRVLELLDRPTIDLVRPTAPFPFPSGAGAALLLELDGDPEGLEAALVRAGELCERAGALDLLVARTTAEAGAMWATRRSLSAAMRAAYPFKVSEDVCVPRGALGELLVRIEGLAARHGLPIASYGHAGDGNLHANLLLERAPTAGEVPRIEAALEGLFRETLALGGTLSGEHGVGLAKLRFLPLEHAPEVIELERRFKALWDPTGLLNPGKILPARRACAE
jgi:glycolate oxidase